jgi:hypothetical protein
MPPKTAHPVADLHQEKECKGCNEVVHPNPDTGKVDVQEHMRGSLVHRAKAEGRTSCPWCGKYCDPEGKGELFLDHAHAEHPDFNLDQQLTCLICGKKWPNTWYIEGHMALVHPILWPPLTRPPPPPQGPQQAPPPQQGPLRCHICYTMWDNTRYLNQHLARAHSNASSQSHQHQAGPSQQPQQSYLPPPHGQHAGHFQGQHHQGGNHSGQ